MFKRIAQCTPVSPMSQLVLLRARNHNIQHDVEFRQVARMDHNDEIVAPKSAIGIP